MFDNKFWQEIKEKYPEAYKKFDYTEAIFDNHKIIISRDDYKDICYCDIEKFFRENEIIINIIPCQFSYDLEISRMNLRWQYEIIFILNNEIIFFGEYEKHIKFNEVIKKAVLKAFEILNNQLKNKE